MRPKNEERKAEVYGFVNDYIRSRGISPTTDEIGRALGMAKSTVSKYMSRLESEGLIERVGRYGAVTAESSSRYVRMPIVGSVACGKPKLAAEDIEGYIPIDPAGLGGGEFFGLIANGDSMIDAGIDDGDVVYIRRCDFANDGDIVVALITDEHSSDSNATLKRFFRNGSGKSFTLHPENSSYEDIIVSEVNVIGVAVSVLKKLR